MARPRKRSRRQEKFPVESLPVIIGQALADNDDFILTYETDPETGSRKIHAFTGKYISSCMLRKLRGLAESQKDEGSRKISGNWY
ncbi:hypothetical protein [uncultured Methanoregula sp.]|uniref:hypothetical protein n=1 Tax=uncultured Methanoregula sp. TaxID=1005933 RepID=UPI002AAB68AC|nr:hypothetical protein [uncultured Methanoregula sp.]